MEAARRHRAPGNRARAPPFSRFPLTHPTTLHYPDGLVVGVAILAADAVRLRAYAAAVSRRPAQ